jgi:hypothetical protein
VGRDNGERDLNPNVGSGETKAIKGETGFLLFKLNSSLVPSLKCIEDGNNINI